MLSALRIRTVLMVMLFCLASCGKNPPKNTEKFTIITAQSKSTVTALHYIGTLAPLSSQTVLSPLDGQVTHVLFEYGQPIQKGQTLIVMDSSKLADDYRKTVSDYLEKKQNYETGLASFQGTQALYKAGVTSQEEYSTAENRQSSDTLSYYQAKYDLEKLLPQTGISFKDIEQLNLTNTQVVNAMLNRQFKDIKVVAPAAGVALFPSADQKKNGGGSSGRIHAGDDLKAGQLIIAIGDLSGLSMKVNVSEISVDLVKPNLTAQVTGNAFPGIVLPGYVASVASQANPQEGSDGGLAMFEVIIKIPKITPEQQRIIRVGMSAAVELNIPEPPQIYLPIKAVYQKNGKNMVTIMDKNDKQQEVTVVTGKTTLDEVAIAQGISEGDRVVVPN